MIWVKIFYALSILFMWVEFYHMTNKHLLYDRSREKSSLDRFFFFSKGLYGSWIIFGLFIPNLWMYFLVLLIISLIRYPVMWFGGRNSLFIYELFNTPSSIMFLFVILGFGLL